MKIVFAQNAKPMKDELVLIGCVVNMRSMAQRLLDQIKALPAGNDMAQVTITMNGKVDPANDGPFIIKP